MQEKKLITVKELSEYLGIGRSAAYTLVATEDFPSIKIQKKFYVPRQSVDDWILKKLEEK